MKETRVLGERVPCRIQACARGKGRGHLPAYLLAPHTIPGTLGVQKQGPTGRPTRSGQGEGQGEWHVRMHSRTNSPDSGPLW